MELHEVIRLWRKELGLTQAQLAERLECSQSLLSLYESAERDTEPPMRTLRKLAKLAGVSVGVLLDGPVAEAG